MAGVERRAGRRQLPAAPRGRALLGLIGSGIQQSLTPSMHEEEARHHGLRLHYQLIDLDTVGGSVEDLPELLRAARLMGFMGLNITYPCKQAILPLLDSLAADAQAMGAVNTVVVSDEGLHGHNTDGSGWRRGFERALPDAPLERVVVVGAGGAGSAIAHSVMGLGAGQLRIVDADPARAKALANALNALYPGRASMATDVEEAMLGEVDGVIQATPVGMERLPGTPIPPRLLRPSMWLSEAIYFPLETELLRAARLLGCRIMDGGAMAVGQAVDAFELFTGLVADAARMERHFEALVNARNAS